MAFVRTDGEERNLFVVRLGESEALGGTRIGNTKLRGVQWIDDGNLLITSSSINWPPIGFTGMATEMFQLVTYEVAAKKLTGLNFTVPLERTFNVVRGSPAVHEVGGKTELFLPGLYVTDRTLPALFKYSVASSDNHAQRYWDRFMGASGPNDPALNEISPIEHLASITAPVLHSRQGRHRGAL